VTTIIWLVIAAALLVIEIITLGLTTIWFAGGAVLAAAVAAFGGNWISQTLVFAIVSFLLLIFTRPFAKKHLMRQEKTNAEGLIGQKAVVVHTINNIMSEGMVKINGMEWTARSKNDETIDEGTEVIVDSISGVKLIVTNK